MDRTGAFPEWVEPMAATLTQERFTSPEWIFERKVDGVRLLAFRGGTHLRLFSRNRLPRLERTGEVGSPEAAEDAGAGSGTSLAPLGRKWSHP